MRPLMDRLEPGELIPNGPFSYYGGELAPASQLAFIFLFNPRNYDGFQMPFGHFIRFLFTVLYSFYRYGRRIIEYIYFFK